MKYFKMKKHQINRQSCALPKTKKMFNNLLGNSGHQFVEKAVVVIPVSQHSSKIFHWISFEIFIIFFIIRNILQ